MSEKEFIDFIVKVIKWVKKESMSQQIPFPDDPVNQDYRRLGNFGSFENSQGD